MANKKIVEQHLVAFTRELHASLTAVKGWHPADRGFAAVAPEIADTYRQARRLAKRMDDMAPGTEYHEWRKAVKTFGYHCRLLRGAWPEILKPLAKEVGRLGEVLGKEHDLTVLAGFASKRPENTLKATPSDKRTRKLIYRRRRELRGQARTIAQRIFVEKPRAYVDRLERWWKSAAKVSGDEKPALGS